MRLPSKRKWPASLIDFSLPATSKHWSPRHQLSHGGAHAFRGVLQPHEDGLIGGSQLSVAMHESEPFTLEWVQPGSDRLTQRRVEPDMLHINPGDRPFRQRWNNRPHLTGLALDRAVVDSIGEESFGRNSDSIRTVIGVLDERLLAIVQAVREELADGGANGRLFTEHLGIAMAAHLFSHHSDSAWRAAPVKGGLGANRLRLVIDYIEAHLGDDLSIATLAGTAGRSLHHFSEAFRQSTGVAPHRYVLIRRIERAKVLLLTTDTPIAQVSLEVGFASQSHFGLMFRRTTGVTPLRFRRDRLT